MLILDESVLAGMKRHGEEGYPEEVCGILIGDSEEKTGVRKAREAHRARNLNQERARDRYELDPADFLRIEQSARRRRWEVVGVYHSHPDHPPRPSETDRQQAEEIWQAAESWSYVILEISNGRAAAWRSWVLRNGVFQAEESKTAARVG